MEDFDYISDKDVYLDSACQSLRPRPVIDALNQYYLTHNSCGERVKYVWGRKTDELVEDTRSALIKYLKLKDRDYFVSFTLNTTYGINLLLSQFKKGHFQKVMTSNIEHNSPFLATMSFAKNQQIPREVMIRQDDGSVALDDYDFTNALVVVNCVSNVDGRLLVNINDLIRRVHHANGCIIIDAAQALGHHADILYKTDADAICGSAHKAYGPSLGLMIVKQRLLGEFDTSFIGGGMVDDVTLDSFRLSADSPNHIYTKFEPGLQAWGEIIGFGAALDWLKERKKSDRQQLQQNYMKLFEYLKTNPKIHLVNIAPSPTISCYIDSLDSHLIGSALSNDGIMVRTGYFCVHYYLDHQMHYPPLIRFSLGYHNKTSDIDKTIQVLEKITK